MSIKLRSAVRLQDQPCEPKSSPWSPRAMLAMVPIPFLTLTASSLRMRNTSRKFSMARRSARITREPSSEEVEPLESLDGIVSWRPMIASAAARSEVRSYVFTHKLRNFLRRPTSSLRRRVWASRSFGMLRAPNCSEACNRLCRDGTEDSWYMASKLPLSCSVLCSAFGSLLAVSNIELMS